MAEPSLTVGLLPRAVFHRSRKRLCQQELFLQAVVPSGTYNVCRAANDSLYCLPPVLSAEIARST